MHQDDFGCTDGNCLFRDNSKTMHTNSGYSCVRKLQRTPEGRAALKLVHHLKYLLSISVTHTESVSNIDTSLEYISTPSGIGVKLDGKTNEQKNI